MKLRRSSIITTTIAAMFMTQLTGCDLKPASGATTAQNSALPSPITVAETITANASNEICSNGGIKLVYGLDHDENGHVGPYESIGMEYLCNPTGSGQSGPRVVTIGDGVPNDVKEKYIRSFNES